MGIDIPHPPPEPPAAPPKKPLRTRALTPAQERRLRTYLDDKFLELTREYKKRSQPTSTLRTLPAYLEAVRHLLSFILQIPPAGSSKSLRTTYMLRLTGEVLGDIGGYALIPKPSSSQDEEEADEDEDEGEEDGMEDGMDISPDGPATEANGSDEQDEQDTLDPRSTLMELLDFLDDLDQAWLAVLQCQVWDPDERAGVDLEPLPSDDSAPNDTNEAMNGSANGASSDAVNGSSHTDSVSVTAPRKPAALTQTDITRLRSILVGGEEMLEDWLEGERVSMNRARNRSSGSGSGSATTDMLNLVMHGRAGQGVGMGAEDVPAMLARWDLLEDFDELFHRTLDFLGAAAHEA